MAHELPLPITTLEALQELLQGLPVPGFSLSPPLRLADHFLMGICHGSPEAPTSTCLDFPLTNLSAVVAVLFANPEHRVGVHSLKEMRVWFKGYGIPITRSQAKQINFLISYGGTAWSLKDYLGMGFGGLQTAQLVMKELQEIYPQLFAYLDGVMEGLVASSPTERYVRSLQGRRRGFVHPGKLTAREKRQAANAVVQMLEADVFKKAILDLDEAIRCTGLPVRMVLLLHDGIWFSCPDDPSVVAQAKQLIQQVMENAVPLSVPLIVEFDD